MKNERITEHLRRARKPLRFNTPDWISHASDLDPTERQEKHPHQTQPGVTSVGFKRRPITASNSVNTIAPRSNTERDTTESNSRRKTRV
jgi:hypothetical protein